MSLASHANPNPTSPVCDTEGGALALHRFLTMAQQRELMIHRGHSKNQLFKKIKTNCMGVLKIKDTRTGRKARKNWIVTDNQKLLLSEVFLNCLPWVWFDNSHLLCHIKLLLTKIPIFNHIIIELYGKELYGNYLNIEDTPNIIFLPGEPESVQVLTCFTKF